jgi:hypothetical protein
MSEVLEVHRGPTVRRETTVYVVAVLGAAGTIAVGFQLLRSVGRAASAFDEAELAELAVGSFGLLLITAILGAIVLSSLVSWQLVLHPGSPDDVVLRFDDEGLAMFDAGSRVFVPWYAVKALTTEPLPTGYRMRVVTDGPVTSGRDRLSAVITRAMRGKGMTFRFSPNDPTHAALAAAVDRLSAGRFRLLPMA